MTANTDGESRGSWIGIMSLVTVHVLGFAMLYFVLVQIAYAFDDHYKLVGYAVTRRFATVLQLSDYVVGHRWLVLCIIATDVYVVYRLARRGSRWTSAYSHTALVSMGLLAFLSIAWMIHPMVWGAPGATNAPVAGVSTVESDSKVAMPLAIVRGY